MMTGRQRLHATTMRQHDIPPPPPPSMPTMAHHHMPPMPTRAHHHHQGRQQLTTTAHHHPPTPTTPEHHTPPMANTAHNQTPASTVVSSPYSQPPLPPCLYFVCAFILPRASSMFAVLTSPFSLSLGSACFHPPSSMFGILTPTFASLSSLGSVCFCPPLSMLVILTPKFALSQVWVVLPRLCSHAPFVSSSVIGVCFCLPSSAPVLPSVPTTTRNTLRHMTMCR